MSAEPDYYGAGRRALRTVADRAIMPREPRERAELVNSIKLLSSLIDGYRDSGAYETRPYSR